MSIPSSVLKQAGDYLLSVLEKESPIRYSRFYDGTRRYPTALLAGMGMSEDDGNWYSAEALIDDAVVLFRHIGVIEIVEVDAKAANGFPDYDIALTEKGRDFVSAGAQYEFPDLEVHL